MKLKAFATLALMSASASVAIGQTHAQNAYYQATPGQLQPVAQVGCTTCDDAVCGCETAVGCATAPACIAEPACGCAAAPGCGCDVAEPACGCAAAPDCGCDVAEPACGCAVPCGCATAPDCGCDVAEPACGCAAPYGCDSGCDSAGGCGLLGGCSDCDLGDPFTLFGEYNGWSVGGWASVGYHDRALPLFNSRPDEVQLHQGWLYAEKAADGSRGLGLGGRIDYIYGTDSQDTQAFGIDNDHWDNDWDHGPDYGHAIPQLYLEAAYGDASVKVGHFYTIIGWEVVTAPDNFFYSHAYTMYNSEPFTHTGVLGTFNLSEDVTAYGGYVFGWDSGFEDNGDAFLGGLSMTLTDRLSVTYATVAGRFAENNAGGEQGYMHSLVADFAVSDNLQYILQSDYLDTETSGGMGVRESIGLNNYLIYTVNDCLAYGARFEWYNQDGVFPGTFNGVDNDIYALTLGLNYKPCANAIVRPEIRWDWDDDQVIGLEEGDEQTTLGIDTIVLF